MLQLENIHKKFGSEEVLKGISLQVNRGDVISILGPSGSGKTTLLRCINLLERPNQGTIRIGDLSVNTEKLLRKDILRLRRKTAMVFQSYNLFANKNTLENVMEGLLVVKKMKKEEAKAKSLALLEKVGLANKADHYPSQLSGGQQQRVGIARALALDPEVILFDEPTSALDPELVGEVLNVIRKIAQEGVTMIIVTHELSFARDISTHVVFMEKGHIVEQAEPKELFSNPQQQRTKEFISSRISGWSYDI
ncbi:amino acid ABC transporter ATP-binding protein [Paenibacillus nasutitermitis]|uniref:Phosphate ABC transporter ATP-binding protein n=1 Tax=Paenibacillus nasutitermitis TaxID=1652958 RepID=A0A917E0C4_9BACL|nr:amino acid ABC transporter ATP-binding protein [Paenibacillus nasutitermitis]GGD88613.1 phosphate ABC transporter ATP-binding protein [Paenibacillus nasutitermitis]